MTVNRAPIRRFPRTYEQDKIFAKLTWRLAPGWQLLQSFHDEIWVNPEPPTFVTPFEATHRSTRTCRPSLSATSPTRCPPNTVWDVRVGRFLFAQDNPPSSGIATTPSRFDSGQASRAAHHRRSAR